MMIMFSILFAFASIILKVKAAGQHYRVKYIRFELIGILCLFASILLFVVGFM